jgi:hypothetical protein
LRTGFILCVALLAIRPLAADESSRVDQLERELARLRQTVEDLRAGQVAADRLTEIERRLEVLAGEIEDLRVGEAANVAVSTASVGGLAPAASKVYRGGSGLSIGGYGEALLEVFDDTRDDGGSAGKPNRFDLLRAIVYFGFKFNDRFVFNSEVEFEHATTEGDGEVSVEFASLDWLVRPELNLRAGLILVPMGFINELHEPTTYLGAKRPESERRIIPTTWRENGIGLYGDIGRFSYRTYVMTSLDAAGFSASGLRDGRQNGSKAKAEDVAWVGRLDWTGTPGLTLGFAGFAGDTGQDLVTSDGRSLAVGTTIWDVHAEWRARGVRLRGLWTEADVDDAAALNNALGFGPEESVGETMKGGYLELGYDVLSRRVGTSSLIPYLRWEQVDTQSRTPTGFAASGSSDLEIFTLGLAYQPIEQLTLKLDWQDVDVRAGSGVGQFNVAFGYIF